MAPDQTATARTEPLPSIRETEQEIAALQRKLRALRDSRANALKVCDRDPGMLELAARLAEQIATVEAQLHKSPTADEQLLDLQAKIAETEAGLGVLGDQKTAAIAAKMRREPDAAARLQQIEEQIDKGVRRLSALKQKALALKSSIADTRATRAKLAAEAIPRKLAELLRERAELAETASSAVRTAGNAVRALEANAVHIASLEPGATNFMSVGSFRSRAMNAFAPAFSIDPTKPLSATNSLLNFSSSAVGERARWSLLQSEQMGIDDMLPLYLSDSEAEAARQRCERRGSRTIVVPLPNGLFTLVPFDRIHGDEGSARRAAQRSATPLAVIAHDGGFVLIPHRFSGEAA